MERKWTPGPWEIGLHYMSIVADGKTGHDDPESVKAYNGHLVCESVNPMNAHLIAAAPDLYEALEICANWIDDEAMKPDTRGFDSLMSVINAALAKARGEA